MGYPAIAAERMEDVDKEISFLEEKIAEMRERSDILKTSTPRPAASRDSGVDTMRTAEERRAVFAHWSHDSFTS